MPPLSDRPRGGGICHNCDQPAVFCHCGPAEEKSEKPVPVRRIRTGYKVQHPSKRGIYRKGDRYVVRLRWRGHLHHVGSFGSMRDAQAARERFYLPRLGMFWLWVLSQNLQYVTNWGKRPKRVRRRRARCVRAAAPTLF
jgi:hypothetical protein